MRKLLIVVLQLLALGLVAQAPKEINYQGVARDAFGVPIGNKPMSIRFEILQASNPTAVFTETQSIITNSLGLFTTQIGKTKNFGVINLENGALQLRVSIDTTGGNSFIDLGLQKLSSVPFALHANSVPTTYTNNILTIGPKSFTLQPATLNLTGSNVLGITGSNTVDITQPVTYSNSVLRVGPANNTVVIASAGTTLQGTGAAKVVTLTSNSFSIHVPTQSLSVLSPATLSITNGNSIALPTTTLTTSGLAQVAGGPLSYNVNVPLLTFNPTTGDLSSGSNVTNITQPLSLIGTTLMSGPITNKVDLSTVSPWREGVPTVTLANNSNQVGIGTGAPNAKLDVQHSGANAALNAQNSNASTTAYAGTFDGGIVTRGKNTLSTASALIAQNSTGTDIFAVRNNADMVLGTTALVLTAGNLGISNAAPTQKLDVTGNVRLSGALMPNNLPGTTGQFLQSNGANNAPLWTSGGLLSAGTTNYIPKWSSATGLTSTSQVFDNGTNVGVGNANPQQKLDVTGSARVGTGALTTDEAWLLSSPSAGLSSLRAGQRGNTEMRLDQSNNAPMTFWTNNLERMRVTGSGDVGIGISTPNQNSTTGRVLTISATTVYATQTAGIELSGASLAINTPVGKVDFNSIGSGTTNIARVSGHRVGGTDDGMLQFHTASAGSLSERMRITEAGRVGINNQSPTKQFQVNGDASITHSALVTGYAAEIINNTPSSGQSSGGLWVQNTGLRSISHIGMTIDNTTTKTGGSNSTKTGLEINSTGSWGAGGAGGHVNRGLSVNVSGGADANYAALFMGGNVGIGLTNPTRRLHVVDNSTVGVLFAQNTTSGPAIAVHGMAVTAGGTGDHVGVKGEGTGGNNFAIGTAGYATSSSQNFGVWAESFGGATSYNIGIIAWGQTGTGAYGAYIYGNEYVGGTLSKSAGTFKIDHPQDPSNKYLIHSFVESPDMMNIYNGNITTDANGDATVKLPGYFEAENIDFRYQLTVVGQFAQAMVLEEISNNQFKIKTDKPSVKVSWQVTGIRNDEYAKKNRIVPEVEKTGDSRGKYLHPELYGYDNDMLEGPGNKRYKQD